MPQFGWKPDLGDARDIIRPAYYLGLYDLPTQVDLTAQCPLVYQQGNLGSCVANACAAAFEFSLLKQNLTDFTPSRLFIYYYARMLENTVSYDSGVRIRDAIKVVNRRGVCPESEWPYDISQFAVQPPQQCSIDALQDKVIRYRRIPQDLMQMKACLASGLPFVFGISVYQSFLNSTDGTIPMPMSNPGDAPLNEGHAMLCVGYNDATQRFSFRNSWGTSYGNNGYGTIPYQYLTSADAADFWEIEVVEEGLQQILPASKDKVTV